MPKNYEPFDWYWIVAGDETKVFSSAEKKFVPINNKRFSGWAADGSLPTRIKSKDELGEVLSEYRLRPDDADVLDGYKEKQSKQITLEVVAKVLFYLVNEVAELKGQQPVNAQQFRARIKDLM